VENAIPIRDRFAGKRWELSITEDLSPLLWITSIHLVFIVRVVIATRWHNHVPLKSCQNHFATHVKKDRLTGSLLRHKRPAKQVSGWAGFRSGHSFDLPTLARTGVIQPGFFFVEIRRQGKMPSSTEKILSIGDGYFDA